MLIGIFPHNDLPANGDSLPIHKATKKLHDGELRVNQRKNFVMDKTFKILITGAGLAATLAAFCAISNNINISRHGQKIVSLENTIAGLQAQCVAKSEESTKSGEGWGHDPLVCDPKKLSGLSNYGSSSLGGTQKLLSEKQNELDLEQQYNPAKLPYVVAFSIVAIAGLPWAWYFLLRRIRELSDAIRGR